MSRFYDCNRNSAHISQDFTYSPSVRNPYQPVAGANSGLIVLIKFLSGKLSINKLVSGLKKGTLVFETLLDEFDA